MAVFSLLIIWHIVVFILSENLNYDFFYYKKKVKFDLKNLKSKIRFYEIFFKIKKWKDKVPQYIDKNGFSKKKLKSRDMDYLKKFINETYKGEWNHLMCLLILPILFFFISFKPLIFYSIVVIFFNVPCIMIQRYNRIRLIKLIFNICGYSNENKIFNIGEFYEKT